MSQDVQNVFPFEEGHDILPFQDDAIQFNEFLQYIGIFTYMGIFDIGILLTFGIFFPTFDIYTDIYFAIYLLQSRCYEFPGGFPTASKYAIIHQLISNGKI